MKTKNRALYITYMGLTEPLLYSQALNYLKSLSLKGLSISIISFEKREFLTKNSINGIKEDLNKCGIKWFFMTYHKRFKCLSKPYDIVRGMFFVLYISFKERIDIIHARGTFCVLIGSASFFLLRQKMIFDMRGLMAEEYADAGSWKRNSFIYKFISKLEQYFARRADEVIILTAKTKGLITNGNRVKNFTIIPTCVDLDKFNIERRANSNYNRLTYSLNGKFVLMYAGSLGTWYMLSEMMDFFRELINLKNDAVFFILSQTDKKWIEQYIPHNLKKKTVIDRVNPENVPDIVSMADIGIFFIKPCISKTASCPTKFAEYLACGLPVIINKGVGDTEEIVKENRIGIVIDAFNVTEYKRAIVQTIELLKEGDILRKRCYDVAYKYFSLKKGVESYSNIYERLNMHKGLLKCG